MTEYGPAWEVNCCIALDYECCLASKEETLERWNKWNRDEPPLTEIPAHWQEARELFGLMSAVFKAA